MTPKIPGSTDVLGKLVRFVLLPEQRRRSPTSVLSAGAPTIVRGWGLALRDI